VTRLEQNVTRQKRKPGSPIELECSQLLEPGERHIEQQVSAVERGGYPGPLAAE
jgi:hypothetical protein